jgi:hypothetical protein
MGVDENLRKAYAESQQLHRATFPSLDGAASLIKLYGDVPSFHDAEVTDLNLRASGGSTIRVSNLFPSIFDAGHVFVTFEIARLIDIVLDGFNHKQNVLGGLHVRPARFDPKRYPLHGTDLEPGDLEIELDSILGIGGTLICRAVKVSWTMDRRAREAMKRPDLLGQ